VLVLLVMLFGFVGDVGFLLSTFFFLTSPGPMYHQKN
jgi:hypothetical protein